MDTVQDPFIGDGEMAALCRRVDWSATPLGPVTRWSQSLRTIVSTMLTSRHPMFLWWGPELVQIYNDGYRPSLGEGGRHPRALGMRGAEFWTEIWEIIGPQIRGVMDCGAATWHEDQLVPIVRNGQLEEVYWTYGYSPVRDDDGCIGGTLVVCQETTPRVLSERALSALNRELEMERTRLADVFRDAPGFAAVLRGPDYVFELANDAYHRLVGRSDLLGKPLEVAVPEVTGQGFISILDRVVETGTPYVGREVAVVLARSVDAPPEERFVDFIYQPLVELDGTRSGVVVHGYDVTEQVHARTEVEIASRAKDDFLALVGHELRSPLAGIANNAQMLAMELCGPLTEKQRNAVQRINRSQEHLLGLIDQLLDLKQMALGFMPFNLAPVVVDDVAKAAASLMDWQFEKQGITLVRDLSCSEVPVRADPDRLTQIVVNLLSNAAKFTPSGGTVTLACAANEELVRIEVRDTGIGIAADKLEAVFQPFVRIRDGRQPNVAGTGLGLAISRDLARGMGGELSVVSELNAGSTFMVELPRIRPDRLG